VVIILASDGRFDIEDGGVDECMSNRRITPFGLSVFDTVKMLRVEMGVNNFVVRLLSVHNLLPSDSFCTLKEDKERDRRLVLLLS